MSGKANIFAAGIYAARVKRGKKLIIMQAKGRITEANNKTNLIHKFDVPDGLKRIIIKFSYSPKLLEDRERAIKIVRESYEKYGETLIGRPADCLPVKNLVTLSVDCRGEYIGAAHRQANEQEHIISEDFSSPGFIKTRLYPGEWDAVLNVHSVSCDVDYKITVEGEEK